MVVCRLAGVLLFAFATTGLVRAQEAAPARPSAVVSFEFVRPGMPVPKYTLRVNEDGLGSYQGEQAAPASPYPGVSSPAQPIDRKFTLTAATTGKIFTLARELNRFKTTCDTKLKNIADMGKKTFSYEGAEGAGTCTYNFSDNKSVTQLNDIFQGIASTMDQGRQLDHLHRFDRLGLDAAVASLADEVAAGRALELGTIQATLRSIAGDPDVIKRARTKASALLAMVPAEVVSK